MSRIDLNDPIAVLLAVLQAFERSGIETAAYGGLALAVYGEPRETKDADLAVTSLSGAAGEEALRAAGFEHRSGRNGRSQVGLPERAIASQAYRGDRGSTRSANRAGARILSNTNHLRGSPGAAHR
jgi:hypothetical protein